MVFALCPQAPQGGEVHFGQFVIPQGEQWSILNAAGEVAHVNGPQTIKVFGAKLRPMQSICVNESEYAEVRYIDGHSEILPGPVSIYEDPLLHQQIAVRSAISLTASELLVVYREVTASKGDKVVRRELVNGPCLYKPVTASEWIHKFSWHGHDPSAGDICRKRPNGLKFDRLQTAPCSTYFDVENVRTSDDALLTIRLMIFYRLVQVEKMLDSTNDPIADIVNSVSSDVIGFCSVRSFEQFKESAEQLNMLGVYQNLTERAQQDGIAVSKVVFRGYMAPQRLQKMHDDAIERRTKLVLERESEIQEQKMKDERLAKEEEREKVKRSMEKARAEHQAEMQRDEFQARQLETREMAQQETDLLRQRQQTEMAYWTELQNKLGLDGSVMGSMLIAKTQGAPAKLIQISGDARPTMQLSE